jgi:hypothetical protein
MKNTDKNTEIPQSCKTAVRVRSGLINKNVLTKTNTILDL